MNINNLLEKFIKTQKGYLVAYIIFMFAYPITSVWLPKYYGEIMDDLKDKKRPAFFKTFMVLVMVNVMFGALDKLDTLFIPKMQAYIRKNIVTVILDNYKDKFEEQELGNLISKIVKLPIVVRDLVRQIRNYIVPIILVLVFVVIRFLWLDKTIGILTLIGICAIFISIIPRVMHCLKISKNMDNDTDSVHESIAELFDNMMNIYSSNTMDKEINRLEKEQEKAIHLYKETFSCVNTTRTWLNTMIIVLFLGLIYCSYNKYKNGKIDLGSVVSISITSMYVIKKIGSFSGELPDIIFNLGIYYRINEYISNLDTKSPSKELYVKDGDIKYENVGIKYGDKEVVKNFNLHVSPGETVAILGNIGSGKSSLIKALLLLNKNISGQILVDDQDISDVNPVSLRKQIVFVPQNPIPFNRNLLENITYGNNDIGKEEVEELFKEYDLAHFFGGTKLEDNIGRKGSKISGGMKTMIYLLRVLLSNEKRIIVLDEPTASLDTETCNKILPVLKKVCENKTVIIITHDTRVIPIVTRIIKLKGF